MSDKPPRERFDPEPSPDWYGQKEKRKRAADDARHTFKVYIAGVLTVVVMFFGFFVWARLPNESQPYNGRVIQTLQQSDSYRTLAAMYTKSAIMPIPPTVRPLVTATLIGTADR